MKKKIIHVNQHKIKSNAKNSLSEAVLTIKSYNTNEYGHEAIIYGQDGLEAARIIYSPETPLSCGARVWIETKNNVKVISK